MTDQKRTSSDELKEAVRELLAIDGIRWYDDKGPRNEGWQSESLIALFHKLEELSRE